MEIYLIHSTRHPLIVQLNFNHAKNDMLGEKKRNHCHMLHRNCIWRKRRKKKQKNTMLSDTWLVIN